jgi:hypothetical protein
VGKGFFLFRFPALRPDDQWWPMTDADLKQAATPSVADFGGKALAYLQLVRFPNLFTAAADILAGYFIVLGHQLQSADLAYLVLSSSGSYAAGCVLNDLADRALDARERPFRPIPSGRVSVGEAYILLSFLLGLALLAAFRVGWASFFVAVILTLLVFSYDILTRERMPLGPINMAACRCFNLLLGMSPGLSLAGVAALFPVITLVYVFSLTCLSRFEVQGAMGKTKRIVVVGWVGTVAMLFGLWVLGRISNAGLVFLVFFALWTGPALVNALHLPKPEIIGRAVKMMILGIPLLDAVYCGGIQGWVFGMLVALCLLPAMLLSRYVYVT